MACNAAVFVLAWPASDFVRSLYISRSELGRVIVVPETQVTEFVGTTKLEAVKTDKGGFFEADIAGVGIGIHLDLGYLKDSGLVVKKGVVTNEFLESSVPEIWAAGDVAEFYDPIYKRYHLLGNWTNAAAQGRTVGLNMTGQRTAFETISMYSTNFFANNLAFLGDLVVDDNTELIERGSLADKKLGRLLIREDQIVGASLVNLIDDRSALTNLIKNRTKVTTAKAQLSNLAFNLATIN